jgi:ribose transport system substrate-binding protein
MTYRARKYGYRLIVRDAGRDNLTQQDQVEDFIAAHVDAIILTPVSSQQIDPAILEANAARIPVFTADIRSARGEGNVAANIASDNLRGGFMAGVLACSVVRKRARIAVIDEPEVTSVRDRVKGFYNAIHRRCPGVMIVDVDAGGSRNWSRVTVSSILQDHPELSVIFGINDDSALGAVDAVIANHLIGKIKIVGYDATLPGVQAIANGLILADIVQYPTCIGSGAVEAIHTYFTGGTTLSRAVTIPVDILSRGHANTRPRSPCPMSSL